MKIIWTFTLLMIPGVVRSMSVTGSSGLRVTIKCKYDEGYRTNDKYFCKGRWSDCADQVKTKEKNQWVQNGRFSLHDDTRTAVFTVTITDLTEQDSGTYYCGTENFGLDPNTVVNLQVITEKTSSSPPSSSSSSPPSSSSSSPPSSSSSPPPSSSSAASSSSVKASAFTGVSRTSSSLESLNTSSGSSLIVPLVLVPLVLIISGLSLLFLCKKHQSRGGDSSSQTGPGEHEEVSLAGCDYDEIKDTHKQLPTNPSASSDFLYASAQLPTIPSASSNCVYATVQKAAGDSQCCITSAEDLNYTGVNFHKESDCPDGVSIRNDQDCSEYAAVNHLTA